MCGISFDLINSTHLSIYKLSSDLVNIPERTPVEIRFNEEVNITLTSGLNAARDSVSRTHRRYHTE